MIEFSSKIQQVTPAQLTDSEALFVLAGGVWYLVEDRSGEFTKKVITNIRNLKQ